VPKPGIVTYKGLLKRSLAPDPEPVYDRGRRGAAQALRIAGASDARNWPQTATLRTRHTGKGRDAWLRVRIGV